jgi:ankyrin repeat protein
MLSTLLSQNHIGIFHNLNLLPRYLDMVSLVIEFGADVNLANGDGDTALSLAAARGHLDVVRLLVRSGADVASVDVNNRCALVAAAAEGHANVVRFLVGAWGGNNKNNNNNNNSKPEDTGLELKKAAQQALVAAAHAGHEQV